MYNVAPDFDIFCVFFPLLRASAKDSLYSIYFIDKQLPLRSINHPLVARAKQKQFKIRSKLCIQKSKIASASAGTSSPRPPTAASPLDPTGGLLSPDPLHRTSPTFCTRLTPVCVCQDLLCEDILQCYATQLSTYKYIEFISMVLQKSFQLGITKYRDKYSG